MATIPSSTPPAPPEVHPGFLYGRVTTLTGATYEGRLRWGGDQEAFWGDYFNGQKKENPWAALVPPGRLPKTRGTVSFFGLEFAEPEREADLTRLFMARMGDIARVQAQGKDVLVTLKSGTVFALDRLEASDFDDGLRVWDEKKGVVDLDSSLVRSVELLPAGPTSGAPARLHGTVRTKAGAFTGFLQWGRTRCVGTDELAASDGKGIRFDAIRSIARRAEGGLLVTRADGGEVEVAGTGDREQGTYVDDPRYGRVLVSTAAFERLDLGPADSGPGYGDFPPGRPLAGAVTTRDGRRLEGRIVFDLDESETTETLDAPAEGVDYTIPFGLVASIEPQAGAPGGAGPVQVALRGGEELRFEPKGDLGKRNAGLLVFAAGSDRPVYVAWGEVARIDFEGSEAPSQPGAKQ